MLLSGEPEISPAVFRGGSITFFCRGDGEQHPGVDRAYGVGKDEHPHLGAWMYFQAHRLNAAPPASSC